MWVETEGSTVSHPFNSSSTPQWSPYHQPDNQNLGLWLKHIMSRKDIYIYPYSPTMVSKMHHSGLTGVPWDTFNFFRKTIVFTTCQSARQLLGWAQWVRLDMKLHYFPFDDTWCLWSWTVNHYFGKQQALYENSGEEKWGWWFDQAPRPSKLCGAQQVYPSWH